MNKKNVEPIEPAELYDPELSPDEDTTDDPPENGTVNADAATAAASSNARLKAMISQNFIEYASYVIKDRAIPDVDDGFKPVQRRILWAMFQSDDGSFHKVAGIIGDTMKYHPHGDASIGDALVYLANKELYIEKQGNYGSIITGKPAAAPRYIECRLSALAKEVLFNRDITPLVDSYDGRNSEPTVLPSKIPTLLIMGADGIAVGTNTKIMPHNFREVLEAQIAILKGEPFTLYPDFIQGGIMDVSKYDDGLGKILVRAKLDIEGRNIVVREIPANTDTERLMDSVESAVNKNKIKIASFHDYTAEHVDIHLVPIRGYQPEKALNALYAYTNCQLSISCNPMVILENRPVRLPVTDILRRNTEKLLLYLTWELQIESAKCLDRILARTLAQLFIEEGVYKKIEKCRSRDAMFKEVRTGLEKFKSEWLPVVQALHQILLDGPDIMPPDKAFQSRLEQLAAGIIPDSEIESLVNIPIRRISAFEVDENREQIASLNKTLNDAAKNLRRIKQYAIKYIQSLLDKYAHFFPRRTEICFDGFEKIDKSAVALNNIRVGWDKKNCYIGTNVKSDDIVVCNEFDHLLCIERSGEYKVINLPEKIFIDRLFEFRKYDKNTVFGLVYSEKKTGKVYFKRTVIGKFITDREYRIIPDGCRLEMITPRPNALYEIRIDTPIRAKQVQTINLMDAPLRSPKAGGSPVATRKLLKITFVQYLDGTEDNGEPELIQAPPFPPENESPQPPDDDDFDDDGGSDGNSNTPNGVNNVPAPAPAAQKKPASRTPSGKTQEKASSPAPSANSKPGVPASQPAPAREKTTRRTTFQREKGSEEITPLADIEREEDDWNIQPDLGF